MRAIQASIITYTSQAEVLNTDAQRFLFFESADPVDLHRRVSETLAALDAEPRQWVLVFVDLSGGGDGHTFTFWAEIVDIGVLTQSQGMLLDEEATETMTAFWLGAQSEALEDANIAAIAASTDVEVQQTLLAGAGQGTRFMGSYVGAIEVPT